MMNPADETEYQVIVAGHLRMTLPFEADALRWQQQFEYRDGLPAEVRAVRITYVPMVGWTWTEHLARRGVHGAGPTKAEAARWPQ